MKTRCIGAAGVIALASGLAAARADVVVHVPDSPIVAASWVTDGTTTPFLHGGTGAVPLDLNGDGAADMTIESSPWIVMQHLAGSRTQLGGMSAVHFVQEPNPPRMIFTTPGPVVAPLPPGAVIGPASTFDTQGYLTLMDDYTGLGGGEARNLGDLAWFDGQPHDAGFSLTSNGHTYYGWVQMRTGATTPPPTTTPPMFLGGWSPVPGGMFIDGWAIETQPDTPIPAGSVPEPATGIVLVMATAGVLRRPRRS